MAPDGTRAAYVLGLGGELGARDAPQEVPALCYTLEQAGIVLE